MEPARWIAYEELQLMPTDVVVNLGRQTLQEAALLAAPVLVISAVIGLLINIVQVVTSLQEATIAMVPKLLAAGAAVFFLMPWLLRHLTEFTLHLLSDFKPYLQ
jgi:flagellar biosynthetic protein FliQ